MLQANYLVIPVTNAIATFWRDKFPDLVDLFDGDDFYITIAPGSYAPVWESASVAQSGYSEKFAVLSSHRLEGFDVNLSAECNCASVYYLLRDLEETSKAAQCGLYSGITVRDYLLPDLVDIKADQEYSDRQCLMEIESSTGSMGLGQSRSLFGTRLMFQILDIDKSNIPSQII